GRTKMQVSVQEPPSTAGRLEKSALPGGPTEPESLQIAGYRVHEQIGAGDLGTIYRATQLASGIVCALKVIVPAGRNNEKAVQTFLREASILNQLQHAHIVRLIEIGNSDGRLYFAMEHFP